MVYLKWAFWIVFWLIAAAFFHYTLPQNDIARITDTYEKRIDFGENSIFWASPDVGADQQMINRDVFFIQAVRANGDIMVYRNEDTGWSWPPYFKFDTSNLQAEAADNRSTLAAPTWVVIKHYGWRNEFLSIFPNAVGLRAVSGPGAATGIPWINGLIISLFLIFSFAIWRRWRRFRQARIDPIVDDIQQGLDAAGHSVGDKRTRFRRWLDAWRAK